MQTAVSLDPVTFQIIRHRLLLVIEEAIIALENVSGSPITNEGHDLMVSLYKRDGGLMVGGVGFMHHLTSASQAVKHIVESFEGEIFEDDVFFLNDSYTAALHPPDVYLISPIFFQGELTGFVANFVHVTDIGAIDPGGFSPNARDNFQEGFQTKGLKLIERGKVRRDVMETFLNMVRDPGMTSLDLKSQLAANFVAKERMDRLYEEFGVETIDAVSEELINQSEKLMRARLRELPDGVYRGRQYVDVLDEVYRIELAVTKAGGALIYDFTGSSSQAQVGINSCYWATWGALFAPIFPLLAWDMVWNDGVIRSVSMVAPQGSVINCRRPAPISIATVGMIQVVNNLSSLVLSKMMGASEKYRDRATGIWAGSHGHVETHGITPDGEFFIAPLTDTFCGAGGARSYKDGVDMGGEIPNVVSRWANVETQELNTPLVYLYRRPVPDSGGPGKYRGGVCHEYAFTPHAAGGHPLGIVLFGKGVRSPLSLGVFGGYPGCANGYMTFRQGNLDDLPSSLETTRGREEDPSNWGMKELHPGDIQYVRFCGGGGYGDPIDRDPQAVLRDVVLGLVTPGAARDMYGVVLDGDRVDETATAERRLRVRSERAGRSVPAEHLARASVPSTGRRMNEYLQQSATGATQCTWCGDEVAPAGVDWKERARLARSPIDRAGEQRGDPEAFWLLQACCPICGTLLDTDVVMTGDPPIIDRITGWPAIADIR